ncbi:Acetyltransferase (GNAT) family protein [Paenibacillus sp. UNCCL117]|uniref:GNAT family N-acetyltransferase n=1 Tax=unclassified Paenibacillus TaxID=185978 RepID=UPI0008903D46|nr:MULTISPECIES: GNAT family N-acetyltransferase [unclassified Paenibacillus]SDE44452.1 Acetyltransferase (GNAT) family protein [Paenibacillus sp. cl123]SFW46271.1 Acetyltransferase (GNAT) family protein [Paenibacillus sp. UNCCL117]
MEIRYDDYVISDDKSRLDVEAVLESLSRSYWAQTRPQERTRKAIEHSYCVGVYYNEAQVGFARVITDWATFFYLCDVYVDDEHRGKGIGKKLVEAVMDIAELEGLMGLLGTRDAHGLYEKYGFIKDGERFMKRPPQWAIPPTP